MAVSDTYLVPIDFSRGSERALDYALGMARERKAKIIVLHVVPAELIHPPIGKALDFYDVLARDAQNKFRRIIKRKKLNATNCPLILARGMNFADVIVRQAKKLRVKMIVMGSNGRTGLQRLLLGSVAERTLRYADRPVLIVKG